MAIIALLGAGGKMGCRITDNLRRTDHQVFYVEVGEEGKKRLAQRGLSVTPQEEAVPKADVVVLAVPDVVLGEVAATVVPMVQPGKMVMLLDPAAAYARELPARPDISYFVTHPCHRPLFAEEETPEGRRDLFGGVAAKQSIVCALFQGPDADYALGEALACQMYGPVLRSHRVTLEQMAMLEPTMAETVAATLAVTMKEALDETVRRGVPAEAARDFMLGHISIALAIAFGFVDSPFSDAAKVAIAWAKERILNPNWRDVFEPEALAENIAVMLRK